MGDVFFDLANFAEQALSDLDFDFHGYAEEHFERLERTASERPFRKALG